MGTLVTSKARNSRLGNATKFLAGFRKHVLPAQSLVIGGVTYTYDQLQASLQGTIDAESAVLTTRAAWQNAVKGEKDKRTQNRPFLDALTQTVVAMFGTSVETLADFGLAPRKPRTVKPATKVLAAQKNLATRKARNTMGKKQKAGIKGTVSAPTTPAPTEPSTPKPAPAATPAPGPVPPTSPAPTPTPHA